MPENFISVAVYNTEIKELAYVTFSVTEASKLIYGRNNQVDKSRTQYLLKNGGKIEAKDTVLGFTVKIKEATLKQQELLGFEKVKKIESQK